MIDGRLERGLTALMMAGNVEVAKRYWQQGQM